MHLKSNLIPIKNTRRAQTKPCAHQDLKETEPDLPLSVCLLRRHGLEWPAAGTGALAAAVLGGVVCGISHLGGGSH